MGRPLPPRRLNIPLNVRQSISQSKIPIPRLIPSRHINNSFLSFTQRSIFYTSVFQIPSLRYYEMGSVIFCGNRRPLIHHITCGNQADFNHVR